MIQSGNVHPICSPSSNAIVFLPSMRYGSLSVDTSYQPSGAPSLGRNAPGVGDQAVDQRDLRAVELAFADERQLDVFRHEHLCLRGRPPPHRPPRRCRHCPPRARPASSRRDRRARDRGRQAARLERVGGVERFVLDEQARQTERRRRAARAWISGVQPSPSVTGFFAVEERHQLAVAPHRSASRAGERVARPGARRVEVVAGEQGSAAGAEVLLAPGVEAARRRTERCTRDE